VFRGTASGTLSDKPEQNAKKISKAMEKIFEKYPPKVKSRVRKDSKLFRSSLNQITNTTWPVGSGDP